MEPADDPAETAPRTPTQTDDRLIVPLDFPNALLGLEMAQKLGARGAGSTRSGSRC